MSELQERIARVICAGAAGMFCDCIGGHQGCKVGRGGQFNGSNCAATMTQLALTKEWDIAGRVIALLEDPSQT